jgi:hypothetical protein
VIRDASLAEHRFAHLAVFGHWQLCYEFDVARDSKVRYVTVAPHSAASRQKRDAEKRPPTTNVAPATSACVNAFSALVWNQRQAPVEHVAIVDLEQLSNADTPPVELHLGQQTPFLDSGRASGIEDRQRIAGIRGCAVSTLFCRKPAEAHVSTASHRATRGPECRDPLAPPEGRSFAVCSACGVHRVRTAVAPTADL